MSVGADVIGQPICDTCGLPITRVNQRCPALDEGVCAP